MRCTLAALALLACAGRASGHDGPPYPILVDWQVEGALVSIWADPDVGVGTFYVYIEHDGRPTWLDGFELELVTHPTDDRELVRSVRAEQPERGEPYQLYAELPFDHRGRWTTSFRWTRGEHSGRRELELDVTPPGFGPVDIVWYLLPFLGVGFLWAKALLRRRAPTVASSAAATDPTDRS